VGGGGGCEGGGGGGGGGVGGGGGGGGGSEPLKRYLYIGEGGGYPTQSQEAGGKRPQSRFLDYTYEESGRKTGNNGTHSSLLQLLDEEKKRGKREKAEKDSLVRR